MVPAMEPTKTQALASASAELSASRKRALLELLADDDQAVYRAIRREVISHGPEVRDWLAGQALADDPVLRRHAGAIVKHFDRQNADHAFSGFCLRHGEDLDLEKGCWLLAATRHPEINIEAYRAIFDDYAHDLCNRIDFGAEPEGLIAGINTYLFKEHGYLGNEEEYYNPDNSYLNRVVDNRSGNPISMCMVYLAVCRRLQLPITGIGLPGHFLCRFQNPRKEIYIDAFNQGRILAKADCMKYLKQAGYEFHEAFLIPASPRRILLRMCSNLHQIYQHEGMKGEADRLQGYIVALSK